MEIGVGSVIDLPSGQLSILQHIEPDTTCVRYRVENNERQQLLLQVYREEAWHCFEHERIILEMLGPHDHLLSLSQAAIVPGPPRTGLLLFDSMPIGSLSRLTAQVPELSEQQVLNYAKEIALGLAFLHSKRITHANLRLENVWVGSDFRCKIAGLEDAYGADISGKVREETISAGIAAPEVTIYSGGGCAATDMWAFGCLLYQLLYKELPFEGVERAEGPVAEAKKQSKAVAVDWDYLFTRLFMTDPNTRAGVKEVCDTLNAFRLEKKGKPQLLTPPTSDITPILTPSKRKNSNIGSSTRSWVRNAVLDDYFPPNPDCMTKLLSKAWNKPQKIPKFFSSFYKLPFNRTLPVIKSLLVLHCYLFKGPSSLAQMHYEGVHKVLERCEALWTPATREKPDENHTEYLAGLIRQYMKLLQRKLDMHAIARSLGNWQGAELDKVCGQAFSYWADMLLLASRLFIGGKEVLDLRVAWIVQVLEDVIGLYTVMCHSLPSVLDALEDPSLRGVYILKFQSNYCKLASLVRGLQRQRPDIAQLDLPETQPEEIQRLMLQSIIPSGLQSVDAFLSDSEEAKEDQWRSSTVQYTTVKAVAVETTRARAATEGRRDTAKPSTEAKDPESPGTEKLRVKELIASSPPWLILMDELQFKEVLSMGIYFTLYKGIYRRTAVAISVLRSFVQKPSFSSMIEQIALMSRVSHPNLVLFMGASVGRQTAIVTEFCCGGSLATLLHKQGSGPLPVGLCYSILRDVARALHGLHAFVPALSHGEVASAAIMLMEEVRGDKVAVKVADFGVRMLLDPDKGLRQIGYWTAPEVLEGREITPAADIYAFGVLVLEVLMRKVPSEEEIREGCVPGQVPANLSNLVIQCVQVRPEMRPTSQMVLDVLDSICA